MINKCIKDCPTCKRTKQAVKGIGKTCPIIYEDFVWIKRKKVPISELHNYTK